MSYKSILVHVDESERCKTRVDLAARLALDFDAHLTGLASAWVPPLPAPVRAEMGDEFFDRYRELRRARARDALSAFDANARLAGVTRLETRMSNATPEEAMC